MIIKKLELQGFKSFPTKTKILFHPGITAVIGPNGTGKSNIVDALLWVLGGKRLKTLRGERGSDLIFNGNTSKPPLSMADVNLYLIEGEEEAIISHRLFRSGESEYRLNGKLTRLKDIQDWLWKKAIGEKDYFVIEQGSIGLFLNSKPTDKRLLVEEAAGTAFYKDKKRQAENKLQSSAQNLTRLDDIIAEVAKIKNSLKRQAAAAIRYRKLRDEIRTLTSRYFRKRIGELEKSQKEACQNFDEFLRQENEILSKIKNDEKNLAEVRKEVWTLSKEVEDNQQKILALNSNLSHFEANQDQNERKIEFLTEKQQKNSQNIAEISQELAQIEREIKETTNLLISLSQNLSQKKKALTLTSEKSQTLIQKKKSIQENVERLRQEYFQALSASTEAKNEKITLDKELELIRRQQERIKSRLKKEIDQLHQKENSIKQKNEEIKLKKKQIRDCKIKLKNYQQQLEKILSSLQRLEAKIKDFNHKKDMQKKRLLLLEEIKKKEQDWEKSEELPQSPGILAELIEADPKYVPLVDIFWKNEVKAKLVKASQFLKILNQKKPKGLYLLLHPQGDLVSSETFHDPRIIGWLKARVQTRAKLKGPLARLQEAAIVKDLRKAVELWLEFPSLNYLTLEGDILLSSGLLKSGHLTKGILSLLHQIKNIKKSLALLEKKISPLDLKMKELIEQKQKIEKSREKVTSLLSELEKTAELKDSEIIQEKKAQEKIKDDISILNQELKRIIQDEKSFQEKLNSFSMKMKDMREREDSLKQSLESEEEKFKVHQAKNEEQQKTFFEFKSELEILQEKIKNFEQKSQGLKQRKNILQDKSSLLKQEIKITEEQKSNLKQETEILIHKIEVIEKDKKLLESRLSQAQANLKIKQQAQGEIEEKLETLRQKLEEIKEERIAWEIKKAERERDLINLEESCWQELKKSPQEIKNEIAQEEEEQSSLLEKLEEAKEKMQKLKAVNLMAEEEYLTQKKRYDFLLKQRQDLQESITATKEAIKKIDSQSKSQFMKALGEINNNFKDIFSLLFQGGSAELKLSDELHPLESGIEIVAQPPGKKLQNLSLLSGGEKSLTSLAFFFALFRYKPAPFCVLDEVDASLDDVNLQRFLNLMKKIKDQTQFIIITHNFKTMEVADYLYGTTMAEPNITTIYSVKIDKKKGAKPDQEVPLPFK